MIIKLLVFPIIWGLALHQTSRLTIKVPPGWNTLVDYGVGVQGTLPIFIIFLKMLGFTDKQIFQAVLAFQVAFLVVGLGVSSGWWLDALVSRIPPAKK